MSSRTLISVLAAFAALGAASPAAAVTNAQIPGLQVALKARGLYSGPVDGIAGPATRAGVKRFQQRRGLAVDGIAGPKTRRALGRLGRPLLGSRVLKSSRVGWDVSVLQFLLERRGVLRGRVDGRFGRRTDAAVRRFQRRGRPRRRRGGRPGDPERARRQASPLRRARPAAPPAARHVVRAGENLTVIAARYGTTVPALTRANRIRNPGLVVVGHRLRVPRVRSARAAGAAGMGSFSVRASLDRWAAQYGVDARLVKALAWMESGFQSHVVSPSGAFGVMQLTPATWDFVETVLLGHKVPRTADGNVQVGVLFLRHLLRTFGGNEQRALAAYYQGPKSVTTIGILPVSRAYIADVLALRARF